MTGRAVVFIIGAFFIGAIAFLPVAAEQTSPAREERAIEIQRRDEALRSRIREAKKIFIEKIEIKGVPDRYKEELESVAGQFERQWLGPDDIAALEESIRDVYAGRGESVPQISSKVSRDTLEITIAGHDKY